MLRGLYTGASGMLINEVRQSVTANNLANIDTTGFKKSVAVFSMEPDNEIYRVNDLNRVSKQKFSDISRYIGNLGTGAVVSDVYVTSKQQGVLNVTDNPADLAISGEGFFAVETKDGVKYTRAGNFAVTKDGDLTDMNGNFVLAANPASLTDLGPDAKLTDEKGVPRIAFDRIRLDPNEKFVVGEEGMIFQNGQNAGKLLVVKFDKSNFINKKGENLMVPLPENGVTVAADYKITQGAIEASNVNAVYEMVSMIELQRAYELNQKVILTQDEMLQKSINSVGRLNG
ncbi:MAG: Flagellar basal-body rod protein FlgF [uncultured bacterium]|nr:MAG: Flagellar basal-body rod protein FlgF [uncultured bacterium]HBC76451.1 flagellar basal body and hook protein [Candidatus Wallbacteria bacterium]